MFYKLMNKIAAVTLMLCLTHNSLHSAFAAVTLAPPSRNELAGSGRAIETELLLTRQGNVAPVPSQKIHSGRKAFAARLAVILFAPVILPFNAAMDFLKKHSLAILLAMVKKISIEDIHSLDNSGQKTFLLSGDIDAKRLAKILINRTAGNENEFQIDICRHNNKLLIFLSLGNITHVRFNPKLALFFNMARATNQIIHTAQLHTHPVIQESNILAVLNMLPNVFDFNVLHITKSKHQAYLLSFSKFTGKPLFFEYYLKKGSEYIDFIAEGSEDVSDVLTSVLQGIVYESTVNYPNDSYVSNGTAKVNIFPLYFTTNPLPLSVMEHIRFINQSL